MLTLMFFAILISNTLLIFQNFKHHFRSIEQLDLMAPIGIFGKVMEFYV